MRLLSWIIVGALSGWLASLIMKRDGSMGAIANIIVGIIGALLGGFIVNALGGDGSLSGFDLRTILISLLGSVVLLAIVNFFSRGKAR